MFLRLLNPRQANGPQLTLVEDSEGDPTLRVTFTHLCAAPDFIDIAYIDSLGRLQRYFLDGLRQEKLKPYFSFDSSDRIAVVD